MSFAFLPLYTGDYRRDTQHLTPLRHGIYLLLLMHCWDTEGPLPLDEQEMSGIANCRSADEIEALRYVVRRFFVGMDDGHYNKRMQREVERAENISGARSQAGRRGYEAKAQAIAKQVLNTCQASASTPTPTPTPTSTPRRSTPTPSASLPADLAVSADLWQAFRESRKAQRAPLTQRAESLLAKRLQELVAGGQDAAKVVEQSIERGWKGLFAVDVKPNGNTKATARAATNAAIWGKPTGRDDVAIDGTAERVD